MTELEKMAQYHRKHQKGLSPFKGLSPDGGNCIFPDTGNANVIANFNKGTSLATDSIMAESIDENNMFSIGDKVLFYDYNKGHQTWGTIRDIQERSDGTQDAVIKAQSGRVYKIPISTLEDELAFDMDESYVDDERERPAYINKLKKYWKNFNGNIRGKQLSNAQMAAILDRLQSAENAKFLQQDPNIYQKKQTSQLNDPKYNFDDSDREGEYTVENIMQHLNDVETNTYKGLLCDSYALQDLYEDVQTKLTATEKQELNKVLHSTNDAETIQNYLSALKAKHEEMSEEVDTDNFNYVFDEAFDDEMTWEGYKDDGKEEIIEEDYTEKQDNWGDPYDVAQIVKTVKDLTNNYTSPNGNLRTYYRVEKNAAINELRNHYKVVEVSDGRRDNNDEVNWIISYADPIHESKSEVSNEVKESLRHRTLDPDNDMMGTRIYYAIKFDYVTIATVDIEDVDSPEEEFQEALAKSKELVKDYDPECVEIVYTVEDNFDKLEDIEYRYWPEDDESLNEALPNTCGDRYYRIAIKNVTDSDGFLTDYTWWYDAATDQHLFIFGDSEMYTPEDSSPDWETDSEETAQEWWDNYVSPYDDDLQEEFFNPISSIESKVLSRNKVDALDELSSEQLGKEIRAAKSLIKQAQDRNDKRSESKFISWLNVLERTKNGESFAVMNDEKKNKLLRRIEGTIKTKGLNKEEAQKFVYNMVSNGLCDQDTYNDVVTSDEFTQLMNNLFNEELQEDYSSEDVKAFLNEIGGYTDYDGKVDELMEYFGMTKDQAESAIQDYVTSPDNDDLDENLNHINEDSLDDKPWTRLDSINRILSVYQNANDEYQDHIVAEMARLAGFPDESYVGGLDPDEYVWTRISDEKLRWLDNVTRLTDANKAKDECLTESQCMVEGYVDLNKDIVFIADACNFDHDTMEPTDTINDVEVTMPDLISEYGETVVEIAMIGVTRQSVEKAGGIPSNWDIGHLINNIASMKFHEANPGKGFVMGRLIEVERMDLLPDAVEVLQRKLGDMLLPTEEGLEEAISGLSHPEQEFDSAATSINSSKLPAIYKMVNFNKGDVVIDFGGGRFDNAVEYIKDKGATLVVYDPYNRSAEHNEQVLATVEENGGADAAVNSNVLNVIKEPEARKAVLENIKQLTKEGAPIYITVYEGRKDGVAGPTKSGYQLNRKTEDYLDEVREVFPNAVRKGKLIFATNR